LNMKDIRGLIRSLALTVISASFSFPSPSKSFTIILFITTFGLAVSGVTVS
jgi:hypothetical protein